MTKGGAREGAGRTALQPEEKKKAYKIYLDDDLRASILEYGIGKSLTPKIVELLNSEIQRRKAQNKKEFSFIDLFAGIGGFHIAFKSLGGKCVFSSEIDSFCQKIYNDNFGMIPKGDITKISAEEIPDFDILTAGFPCQPFSYAGRGEGFEDKTRGTLFFEILRILKAKRPKMFLLENVKGLKSHKNGETMDTILKSLKDAGYHVHWTILNSHDFGVPQKRERWYCVGFDKDIYFEFPKGDNNKTTLKDIIDINLKDPKLELTQFEKDRIKHHFESKEIRVQHDNSKYDPNTKKGKYGVFSFLKPDGTLRFHIGDVAKTQIQEAYYCSLNSVAPAIIVAREPKLWDIGRKLSVDECRKLQGFPDDFKLDESDLQAKKQLGNSIAIPVVKAIAQNMILYYNT